MLLLQSCPTFCDPMDRSPPGSSVHGISQARRLEWIAIPSSRASSRPRDQTHVSCIFCTAGRFFPTEPPGKLLFLTPGLTQLLPKLQGCPNHPGHSCPHHSPAHYLILCFSTILNRVYLFKLTHSTSLASIYKNEKQGTCSPHCFITGAQNNRFYIVGP